jgi:hypothetical protein
MTYQQAIHISESADLPEPYVACLEVVASELDLSVNLYIRTGLDVETLREWLTMRLNTLDQGFAPDEWTAHDDGDQVIAQTMVRMVELPDL